MLSLCVALITEVSFSADTWLCLLFHRDDSVANLDNTICLRRWVWALIRGFTSSHSNETLPLKIYIYYFFHLSISDDADVFQASFNLSQRLTWTNIIINIYIFIPPVPYPLWFGCGWRSTAKTSMSPLSTRPSACCVSTCGIASASDVWLRLQRPSSRGSRPKVESNVMM